MKGYAAGLAVALLLLLLISGALAQDAMRLYVQDGALEDVQIRQMLALLDQEDARWTMMEDERTLRELVLAGDLPDLAICAPAQVRPWAKEGMMLELQTHIGSQQRMQRQVLDLCVHEEALYMAPLKALHRQMAVNGRLFDEMGLGYMLDPQAYPVWYPAQFYQILEEFMIRDRIAVDIWHAELESSAPLEALTQAIYGGTLLSEDGKTCEAGGMGMITGVQWLCNAVDDGMIGYRENQEDALKRFLSGETAIYLDWTEGLGRRLESVIQEDELHLQIRPYPAAVGLPVRSFDLIGVCAFKSGDAARDARLTQACAKLHEHAQEVLGPRGIWQDGAFWPASLDACDAGATLRSLFCSALEGVIEQGKPAHEALAHVQAAMDAVNRTK